MKREISFSGRGQRADIGDMIIYRILPNRYADAVGPFVFLDYIAPIVHSADETGKKKGTGPHPHRGIATLTYVLNGEDEHFDSIGNQATVSSGGVQWMKAGNGIVHDENLTFDPALNDRLVHGFQFWINLPAVNKAESPQYLALQASEVPSKTLENQAGWVKIILGAYENMNSQIPNYSKQFLFHVHLEAGKQFTLPTDDESESAAFLPLNSAMINGTEFNSGEFIEFGRKGGTIEINNHTGSATDILLFGGEKYTEPIVAEGPFVMNSRHEIAQAYKDYFAGKYGIIS
jgi:redox-sensitive bicupin YhaK (pirin superfamily)